MVGDSDRRAVFVKIRVKAQPGNEKEVKLPGERMDRQMDGRMVGQLEGPPNGEKEGITLSWLKSLSL